MNMKTLLAVLFGNLLFLQVAAADVWINRSLVNTGDVLTIKVMHPGSSGVQGDVYAFFLTPGQDLTEAIPKDSAGNPVPSLQNVDLGQTHTILDVVVPPGLPAGRYYLVEITTVPGGDPRNLSDWLGGVGAFNRVLFFLDDPVMPVYDRDGDGFFDDDANHDGFHDVLDDNYDGYYDDDSDRDGYHDDDANHDGYHDDDLNHDGYHDDDLNHDGYHDNNSGSSSSDSQHDSTSSEGGSVSSHSESEAHSSSP